LKVYYNYDQWLYYGQSVSDVDQPCRRIQYRMAMSTVTIQEGPHRVSHRDRASFCC